MIAPDRMWVAPSDSDGWHGPYAGPIECEGATEYRRTDAPLTPSEALRCPKVQALVEALEGLIQALDTDHDNGKPVKRSPRVVFRKTKARAALAPFQKDRTP